MESSSPTLDPLKTTSISPVGNTAFLLSSALVIIVCVAFNWMTGHRGAFLNDQSLIWDGAWRILQGQVPYRDFWMPFGPVTFAIQAVFFRVMGVTWAATVASACLSTALATTISIRLARLLLPEAPRPFALLSGLSVGLLFQAIFGTLWMEQTAFLFGLASLWLILESPKRRALLGISGICLVLSVLSKQNAGGLMTLYAAGLIVILYLPSPRRIMASLLWCGTGFLLGVCVFLLWLFTWSDPAQFLNLYFKSASGIGQSRMSLDLIWAILSFEAAGNIGQLANLLCQPIGLAALVIGLSDASRRGRFFVFAPAGYLCAGLPVVQVVFQVTTRNEEENVLFLSALAVSLAVSLALLIVRNFDVIPVAAVTPALRLPSRRVVALVCAGSLCLFQLGFLFHGTRVAWRRLVQEFEPGAVFSVRMRDPGLNGLLCGSPGIFAQTVELKCEDFEAVTAYLKQKPGNFYIFGDAVLLYGLLQRPSPQPVLHFMRTYEFLSSQLPGVDQAMVHALRKNGVTTIVNETSRWYFTDPVQTFPALWRYMQEDFTITARFGIYEVWEKKQ